MKHKNKWLICLSALMILMTCLGCSSADKITLSQMSYQAGSVEDAQYTLEMDENGFFTLVSRKDGYRISSVPATDTAEGGYIPAAVQAALVVEIYTPSTGEKVTLDSYSSSALSEGLKLRKEKNEIIAEYTFVGVDLTIPVHYTLRDGRFSVTVIPSEMKMGDDLLVQSIALHPYFGGGSGTDDGFMVVPDGSGALIRFNTMVADTYEQKIYGLDQSLYRLSEYEHEQPVVMPMFGISNAKTGVLCLGVVTGGVGDASVLAECGNDMTGFNGVWANFNLLSQDIHHYDDYRPDVDMYAEELKDVGPLQVTYLLERSDAPDYVQLAKLYRQYLVEEYGLSALSQAESAVAIDTVSASVKKKTILGIPYNGVQTLTTYEQCREMVEEMAQQSIPTVLRLTNWSTQTVRGKTLTNISLPHSLGSKSELEQLLSTASKNGKVYLAGNISEVYSGGFLWRFLNCAKDMRGSVALYQHFNTVTRYNEGEGHYLLSNAGVLDYTKTFGQKLSRYNQYSGVAVDGLNTLYTDFGSTQGSMTTTVNTYTEALKSLKEQKLSVAVNGGNAFSLPMADFIFSLPSEDSNYDMAYEEIPFYQLALHGLISYSSEPINLSSDPQKAFLKAVETGSLLQYRLMYADAEAVRYSRNEDLYSSTWSRWKDVIGEQYREWLTMMEDKQTLEIVGHQKLANGVYQTVYADGSSVLVNYSDTAYQYQGVTVEAMGCASVKGENRA